MYNRNYQSAGPEIKEIWTLEADIEAISGIERSTAEDKEKCISTNTKITKITRPTKWLSSR
jgi:regulatory protein YycH of two-component signal transduction system YycFG